ncbi:hypothetical protein TNCV_3426861 [Trichonephila clavipes]|nr:hypothetical protein TNCV_3426861 [Trichonephila clavipes]
MERDRLSKSLVIWVEAMRLLEDAGKNWWTMVDFSVVMIAVDCLVANPASNFVLTIIDDVSGDAQGSVPILLSLLHAPQVFNQELMSGVPFLLMTFWSSLEAHLQHRGVVRGNKCVYRGYHRMWVYLRTRPLMSWVVEAFISLTRSSVLSHSEIHSLHRVKINLTVKSSSSPPVCGLEGKAILRLPLLIFWTAGAFPCDSCLKIKDRIWGIDKFKAHRPLYIVLQWVPIHVGISGNERADQKYKQEAELSQIEVLLTLRIAEHYIHIYCEMYCLDRKTQEPWKARETLANVGFTLRHLEKCKTVACFRLPAGHYFLGIYLHWLGCCFAAKPGWMTTI